METKDTGTVTVDGKASETAEKYFDSTTVVPIIATPAKGYEFKEWQGMMREGQSNPNNSVLIIDNSSRTAVFVPKTEEAK